MNAILASLLVSLMYLVVDPRINRRWTLAMIVRLESRVVGDTSPLFLGEVRNSIFSVIRAMFS